MRPENCWTQNVNVLGQILFLKKQQPINTFAYVNATNIQLPASLW